MKTTNKISKPFSNYSDLRSFILFSVILGVSVSLAYINSFRVPLIFDDNVTLKENMSIRHLGDWLTVLSAPTNPGLAWRPFSNITFSINYAFGALNPLGYHVVNLIILIISGLTLYAILCRTLVSRACKHFNLSGSISTLSASIAILWAVNPLLTQSVTYLSQRSESLSGLFYLLTLYFFLRGTQGRPKLWYSFAIAASLLGAMSKEVIVTAPFIILAYDRTFITNSFKESIRSRLFLYLGLCATWIPLAVIMHSISRTGAVGFGIGVSPFTYALTECKALCTYIRLCLFPYPLIFDRGREYLYTVWSALPYAIILISILTLGIVNFIKVKPLGFILFWFFVVLAPTSSFIPITEVPCAENRLFLPLIATITLFLCYLWSRVSSRNFTIINALLIIISIVSSYARNNVYQTEQSIWSDTLSKLPTNARAHNNLGLLLSHDPSHRETALEHFKMALKIQPIYADAECNLGMLLALDPKSQSEALAHYIKAIQYRPDLAEAHTNYANIIASIPGKTLEAQSHYLTSLSIKPFSAETHNDYGALLANALHKPSEAMQHYETALNLSPNYADAHNNLANLLVTMPDKLELAVKHYRIAETLNPESYVVHFNLGLALEKTPSTLEEAAKEIQYALSLNSANDPIVISKRRTHLAYIYSNLINHSKDSINECVKALELYPQNFEANLLLAKLYARNQNTIIDSLNYCTRAIEINKNSSEARELLNDINTKMSNH